MTIPKFRNAESGYPCLNGNSCKKERRSSKAQMKKASSEESKTGDESKEDMKENCEEQKSESKESRFEPVGYEHHLVDTIEKDILQRDTAVR